MNAVLVSAATSRRFRASLRRRRDGSPFKLNGFGGSNPQHARAESNSAQPPASDQLIDVFARDEPVRRQLRNGDVGLGMGLEILDTHTNQPDRTWQLSIVHAGSGCVSGEQTPSHRASPKIGPASTNPVDKVGRRQTKVRDFAAWFSKVRDVCGALSVAVTAQRVPAGLDHFEDGLGVVDSPTPRAATHVL